MSPAPISEVAYLHLHILINQRASLMLLDFVLLIYSCGLPLHELIMLCLYPLLYLALLDEELLNFGAEVSIVQVLVLFILLVHGHVWE